MIIKPFYESAEEVHRFLYMNQNNKEYENLFLNDWIEEPMAIKTTWSEIGFSFYTDDKELAGWIKISIRRPVPIVNIDSFAIINKKLSLSIFKYAEKFIKAKMNFTFIKLTFQTMVDSEAEEMWDRISRIHNGRVVGISKKEVRDINGRLRDRKKWEILNPNFKDMG